jgi:hypothetical protein
MAGGKLDRETDFFGISTAGAAFRRPKLWSREYGWTPLCQVFCRAANYGGVAALSLVEDQNGAVPDGEFRLGLIRRGLDRKGRRKDLHREA